MLTTPREDGDPLGIAELLRTRREELQLTLREAAKRIGINNGYLSQLERGERTHPSAEVLMAIAKGLSLSTDVMYSVAGLLDDVDEQASVLTAIQRDEMLTSRQKAMLLTMYRSFRESNQVWPKSD